MMTTVREYLQFGVLDLETQRSAAEVGGWHRASHMGISCVVIYDSAQDTFIDYTEHQIPAVIDYLLKLDLVVGFNIKRFDYKVLQGYSRFNFKSLPTLDILEEIHHRLGYRLSLDHLARVTLNRQKSTDGLQALRWWKQGRIKDIIDYCQQDVALTRDLFLFGKANGHLLFMDRRGRKERIPVHW